jgi:hypothetical protein
LQGRQESAHVGRAARTLCQQQLSSYDRLSLRNQGPGPERKFSVANIEKSVSRPFPS